MVPMLSFSRTVTDILESPSPATPPDRQTAPTVPPIAASALRRDMILRVMVSCSQRQTEVSRAFEFPVQRLQRRPHVFQTTHDHEHAVAIIPRLDPLGIAHAEDAVPLDH